MQACFRQVADKRTSGVRLVEGVSIDPELDSGGAGAEERLENHGHGGFAAVHACVEEADCWGNLPGVASVSFKGCCRLFVCLAAP